MDERIEDKFLNGGRFLPEEIDSELLVEAERFTADYAGDFAFMVDLKRQLRRGRFSAAQAKGALNVLLSDLRREAKANEFKGTCPSCGYHAAAAPVEARPRPQPRSRACDCGQVKYPDMTGKLICVRCDTKAGWGANATYAALDATPEFDPEDQLRREEVVNEPATRLEQALAWLR